MIIVGLVSRVIYNVGHLENYDPSKGDVKDFGKDSGYGVTGINGMDWIISFFEHA